MTTFSVQPDATAGQDTYMYLGNKTSTNGKTSINIAIGQTTSATYDYRGLIKFDLSSIPATAVISSAVLSLYYKTGTDGVSSTMKVYRQKRAWTENGACWSYYTGTTAWAEEGGFGSDDCEQTEIGSVTISDITYGWKNISLTASKVQEWISGALTNNGLLLKETDETTNNSYKGFYSSDYTDDTSLRPKFEVVYTVPTSGNPHYYFAQL